MRMKADYARRLKVQTTINAVQEQEIERLNGIAFLKTVRAHAESAARHVAALYRHTRAFYGPPGRWVLVRS